MLSREMIREILAKPSGLYSDGCVVVKRQKGVGFVVQSRISKKAYQESTYDEYGNLVDVSTYIE